MKKIEDPRGRKTTFSKRGDGFLKKAHELSTLCNSDIGVIMFSPSNKLISYCQSKTTIKEVLQRFVGIREGQRKENIELVDKLMHQRNTERKGKHPLLSVLAVQEQKLVKQRELVTKKWKIECIKSSLEQAEPFEDLIRAQIKQSISLAELGDLENLVKNGLSKVQEQRHDMESKENLRGHQILEELKEILSSPVPHNRNECYPFAEATNKAGTSLPQSLPILIPTSIENLSMQSLHRMEQVQSNFGQDYSFIAGQVSEVGAYESLVLFDSLFDSSSQFLPMPTPMDNPYLQYYSNIADERNNSKHNQLVGKAIT